MNIGAIQQKHDFSGLGISGDMVKYPPYECVAFLSSYLLNYKKFNFEEDKKILISSAWSFKVNEGIWIGRRYFVA